MKTGAIRANLYAPVREETFEGRPYLVAPVVMLVEGVHAGSAGPVYYPPSELAESAELWNGSPVVVFHPIDDGIPVSANDPIVLERQEVGRVFYAIYEAASAKLKAEVWVDIERANQVDNRIVTMLRSGVALEVSTGLRFSDDATPGNWNGEEFGGTVTDYRPDHLALLPGVEGACSWSDGCGVRANKATNHTGEAMKIEYAYGDKTQANLAQKVLGWLGLRKRELTENEVSLEELRGKLQAAVDALDNESWTHYVRATFDGYFIYEASSRNPSEVGSAGVVKLYKRGYTADDEGNVTIAEDAIEVTEKTEYVPVGTDNSQNKSGGNPGMKGDNMANEKVIAALIANDQTRFTENDKDWLGKMTDCQLATLAPVDPPKTTTTDPPDTKPVTNDKVPDAKPGDSGGGGGKAINEKKDDGAGSDTKPKAEPVTVETYIANAPPEVQAVLTRAVASDKARKAELVRVLVDNERCKFTIEQLEAKGIEELENMAALGNVPVDFSGQAGGVNEPVNKNQAPPMPPVYPKEEQKAA